VSTTRRGEILERIRATVLEVKPQLEGAVAEDALFVADLGLDSLDLAELVASMEQAFRLRVPDEDFDLLLSPGEAADYIGSRLDEQ
jgi:acyl carrier protein